MTSSHGSFFRVTCPSRGEFTGHGWIPLTKGQPCGLWCIFDVGPHKVLNTQSNDWWFQTKWRSCDVIVNIQYQIYRVTPTTIDKQRVLMHGHQGWNVRHGLCHIYMIYVYIWVVYSFCLFCCLFIIVTTQFVALYKPCKPKPKPSTYDPPDNHPLAEIQRPILRPEPKQQICHQHANTDHLGK